MKRNFTKKWKAVLFSFFIVSISMSNLYAQVNLSSDLFVYIPFDGNGQDYSGNNNNVVNVSGSIQTYPGTDRFMNPHKSMRFVGERGKAQMSFGTPLLNNKTTYSISFWVMMNGAPISLNKMNIFGQDALLEFYYENSPNQFVIRHATGDETINLTSPYYNTWRHIVITGNTSEFNVYMNGVNVVHKTGDYSLGNNTYKTNIGGEVINHSTTGESWMVGNIDELRIYNRVITADEIDALYTNNLTDLNITNINNSTFCAGSSITVDYTANGNIQSGNIYSLQLSQPDGTFKNPIILDSIASTSLSGTFTATIPTGVPSGTNYKIRVVSSKISATSNESSPLMLKGITGNIPNNSTYIYIGNGNGRDYYKSTTTSEVETANNTAIINSGHLATIHDATTNQLLWYNARNSPLHIGINDLEEEGIFVWRDGSYPNYTNWDENKPDNASATEYYGELRYWNGKWNDIFNTKTQSHYMELLPAGNDRHFCLGEDLQLNAAAITGATYAWTGPNGFSSALQNPLVTNAQNVNAGTYTLTYTLNGCSVAIPVQIDMSPLPIGSTISVIQDSICPENGTTISIENTDATISYQLQDNSGSNIGAAQMGNGSTLTFSTGVLTTTTDFQFHYEFTATGCNSISDLITVHVRTNPTAPSTTDDKVCYSGSMTVSVSGSGTYHWYTTPSGGTAIANLEGASSYTVDTNSTQTLYVSVADAFGCESDRTLVTALVQNPLNPPVDLHSDLILHYKFDGDFKDYSGNGYDATPSGNITFVNDKDGNPSSAINSMATAVPGNNFINAGNTSKIQQLTNQVTISMWVRHTQTWFAGMPLLNKWDGTGMYIMLGATAANNKVRWRINDVTFAESNTNVPMQEWHHIVCTYNGSQLKIYQNGVLTGTANTSTNIPNTSNVDMLIGRQANYIHHPYLQDEITYRGDIDEVKIYGRALVLEEIQTLHNNESVAFTNTPFCDEQGNLELTTFDFPGATYQWTGPNGFTSTERNPPAIPNADSTTYAGEYQLQVTVDGCTSPIQKVKAVIHEFPALPFVVNDTVCGSGNAVLTASGATGGATYVWYTTPTGGSPIAGQTGNTLTINNLTATTSRYVALTRNGCETDRVEVKAVFINPVQTNLTVNGDAVCSGVTTATITVLNTEAGINYQAFNGTDTISTLYSSTGGSLTLTINTAGMNVGNNPITIKANYPSCGSVDLDNTATLTIHELPTVSITPSGATQFCQGGSVDLTATAAVSHLWSTTETTATIQATSSGTYSVTITDNNNCKNTASQLVTVDTPPTASIVANGATTFCQGDSTQLTASGGTSYLWSNGATTASIYVTQEDTYSATVFNGTCSVVSTSIQTTVLPAPTVSITANHTSVCQGETVTLSGNGAIAYQWSGGISDGVAFTPASTQSYTVTGTDNNNCQAKENILITVNALPDATFTPSTATICPTASSIDLTATGTAITTYDWYKDNAPYSLNGASSIAISNPGDYKLTVTDNNNCTNDFTKTIINGTTPQVSITVSDTVFCANSTASLTATLIAGANYVWYKDGNPVSNSILEGTTYSASEAGNYSVEVTNNDGCIGLSNTLIMTTITPPIATISAPNTSFCTGNSTLITANLIVGAMYEWFLDGSSLGAAQLENNTWNAAAVGSYTVKITTSCSMVSNAITMTQVNQPNAAGAINGMTKFCTGNSITYTLNTVTGATNYLWEVIPANAASIGSGQGTTSVTVNTTNQNFTLKVTPQNTCGNGTAATLSIAVGNSQFDCPPDIYFYANKTNVCEGSSVIFTNESTINNPSFTAKWDFGLGASPATATGNGPITVTYSSSGPKTVTLAYVDMFGNLFLDATKTNYITVSGTISTSAITGNVTIDCNASQEDYSVVNTAGSTYQWTVPQGATIVSGQGTSNIVVNFNGNVGTLSVQETNAAGCVGNFVTENITLNNMVTTTPIAGNTTIDCKSTQETYSVANTVGSTYQWTVPQGATIVSGQGTNSIAVNFNGVFGAVSVIETNETGCVGEEQTITVTCDDVGLDDNTQQTIAIYPNPTTDIFQILYDGTEQAEMVLYEANGKVVRREIVKSQDFIDIRDLSKAIYFGKLTINKQTSVPFKIIKK